MSWSSEPAESYQVQPKNPLSDLTWINVGPPIVATSLVSAFTNGVTGTAGYFGVSEAIATVAQLKALNRKPRSNHSFSLFKQRFYSRRSCLSLKSTTAGRASGTEWLRRYGRERCYLNSPNRRSFVPLSKRDHKRARSGSNRSSQTLRVPWSARSMHSGSSTHDCPCADGTSMCRSMRSRSGPETR